MFFITQSKGDKNDILYPFYSAEEAEEYIYKNNENIYRNKGTWTNGESVFTILSTTRVVETAVSKFYDNEYKCEEYESDPYSDDSDSEYSESHLNSYYLDSGYAEHDDECCYKCSYDDVMHENGLRYEGEYEIYKECDFLLGKLAKGEYCKCAICKELEMNNDCPYDLDY